MRAFLVCNKNDVSLFISCIRKVCERRACVIKFNSHRAKTAAKVKSSKSSWITCVMLLAVYHFIYGLIGNELFGAQRVSHLNCLHVLRQTALIPNS
jgi:hypothetical protein